MLFGWLVIGLLIYWFFKNKNVKVSGDTAEALLKEKFINGEIDEETYVKMKQVMDK